MTKQKPFVRVASVCSALAASLILAACSSGGPQPDHSQGENQISANMANALSEAANAAQRAHEQAMAAEAKKTGDVNHSIATDVQPSATEQTRIDADATGDTARMKPETAGADSTSSALTPAKPSVNPDAAPVQSPQN